MLAYVPLWFLMMAMFWEQIKLDKKNEKEFEQFRKNCRAYEKELNKKIIADYERAAVCAIEQALKEKNNGD